ncbi:MAG: hypothetical protein IJZ56_01360 [Oscillospiraceae bacterium]|nr:hypothetical protein [Oscillospiraceae bacterium]
MENKRNDHIIYFKDLLFAALYRWRAILAVALLAAVLLGALQCIPKDNTDADILYQDAKKQYDISCNVLNTKIDILQNNLNIQLDYVENSIFMQLNPYSLHEATLKLYADTGYQINPGLSYQAPDKTGAVLSAYEAGFLGDQITDQLAQAAGTTAQHASELIACTTLAGEGTITVVVRCTTNEMAQACLDALAAQIDSLHTGINEAVTAHTVSVLSKSVTQKVDLTLVAKQAEVTDRITSFQKLLTEAQQQRAALVAPQHPINGSASVVKNAVIFAVLGFILGAFVSVCVIWVVHIISGKVYSARTLRDRTGLNILGCLPGKISKNTLDRWLQTKEGRCLNDIASQTALLAACIRNRCGEDTNILVTGDNAAEDRNALVEALQASLPEKQIAGADSLRSSADAQTALAACDAVIMVVQCGVCQYSAILADAEIATECNKTLIGCIVLGG